MKDQISITRVKALHPDIRKAVTGFIAEAENELGITLRIVQGLRTVEEQNALYAKGRTAPGQKVTNAKGGSSFHNYGLAIDVAELKNGVINWGFDYDLLLPFANKYGFKWGGMFTSIVDKPHFEKTFKHTWRQLLEKHNKKMFIPGTNYVKL